MATRGRPRAFDPDAALRKALAVFWERGYEGTSMNDLVEAMGIASASIYAAFGSKAELFRRTMGLYGATRGEPPRRALREQPTARGAIEAMLRATADEITRPDDPHYCMLILAAPTGAVENHEVREFLAGGRRAMQAEIRARLARGAADGDLDRLARHPRRHRPLLRHRRAGTVHPGPRRRQPGRAGDGHRLRDGRLGHARGRARPAS